MQGKAAFRGHPLHLISVSFPVAFWSGALVTDAAGFFAHDPFWFRMSTTLVAMGTLGAVVSSVFGYVDYRTVRMSRAAAVVATRHLWASVATIAVFAVALALRVRDDRSLAGIAITALGAAGLLAGAYYGSELSSRFGIGVQARPRGGAP